MTTVVFQEIIKRAEKSGACSVCGKTAKRSEKFWQTVNPFNKNLDGSIKSSDDIRKELDAQIAGWRALPIVHAKCKP
jgi:hypothetical protein